MYNVKFVLGLTLNCNSPAMGLQFVDSAVLG